MSAVARRSARERILSAAVRRIAQEGIDGVRIARIATDARVSPALVHYHFATRDALLAQALEYSYAHAGDARITGAEAPSLGESEAAQSHAERLASMIEQSLPTTPALEDDWVLWVELWLRAVRHHEFREVAESLYARMHVWFATEIAAGVAAGEFAPCDPGGVADRLIALIDGYGVRTLIGDRAVPLERARRAITDVIARELAVERALQGEPVA